MTPETLCSPTVTVAVLCIAATDGRKAIAAVRNVPHNQITVCVETLRQHGTDTGYHVAAYCTSDGFIELIDSSLVETDILQLVAETARPNPQPDNDHDEHADNLGGV
jgi:hypothetical protein